MYVVSEMNDMSKGPGGETEIIIFSMVYNIGSSLYMLYVSIPESLQDTLENQEQGLRITM